MTVPALGAVIGFITFIASMIISVSPALTVWPALTNGAAPGSGERKAVPTIGDLTASTGAAAGAASAASGGGGSRGGGGEAAWPTIGHSPTGDVAADDLDLAVAVLDFDFGQFVGGQQLGQFANQRAVDAHRLLALRLRPYS